MGAVVTYADIEIDKVEKMAHWVAASRMFGADSASAAAIIVMDCIMTNTPLMEYQRRNQLISGRPGIPYDAMLAAFHENGGKSEIISRTPEKVSIALTPKDGKRQEFTLTWEDAKKEPFVYNGKEKDVVALLESNKKPEMKSKYATPRSRTTMLFARVVSDGIRAVSPEVNFGYYTPEEHEDINDAEGRTNKASEPSKPSTKPTEVEAKSDSVSTETTASENTKEASTVESDSDIKAVDEAQRNHIIGLMKEVQQTTDPDIAKKVTSKLKACGISKGLLGLSMDEGLELQEAIKSGNVDHWIENAKLVGLEIPF